MEPRIQYAKTSDGVSIAYTTTGEGTPLVRAAIFGYGTFQDEMQNARNRAWLDSFTHKFVLYDGRNVGLSSKSEDSSLDAYVRDLDAVVDALGYDRISLYGPRMSGSIAISYAATHPDRVSHLILFCAGPSNDVARRRDATLRNLAQDDWELYTLLIVALFADAERARIRKMAKEFRERFTAEEWIAHLDTFRAFDSTPLLEQVRCPTLVLQRRGVEEPSLETARLLATRIPHAELVLLEGDSNMAIDGDYESMSGAVNEFLADQQATTPQPTTTDDGAAVHTILFTDMASSTSLNQQLGDAAAQEIRRTHDEIVREALNANAGSEVKHTGDGIMASFATASSALAAAIAIQRGVAAHKAAHTDSPLGVYVGLNAGEPIAEEGDLFGTSINLAARICDHAEAGQIVAADVVRQLAAGKDFLFSDLGETELRGFEDPVKLWELRWQDD